MTKKFIITFLVGTILASVLTMDTPQAFASEDGPPPYYNIQITELLPDPASPKVDSDDEYIELYNPYDFPVDLSNYSLHSGSISNAYDTPLTDITLAAHEYRAFYSKDTNLTLVNSSAGQAWLVSPNFVRVSETPWYPAGMGENKAWAKIGDAWVVTTNLTPGAQNQTPVTPPIEPPQVPPQDELETCPEGKYRNPETNRCKNIEASENSLTPCGPGQERNPATNRCRSIVASNNSLTPCDSDEERNPDTNRCRKITSTSTQPSACQSGYERNPETNRCRKITAVKAATTLSPSNANSSSKVNYLIMVGVSTLVLGYAAYEYRNDLRNSYAQLKKRFSRSAK